MTDIVLEYEIATNFQNITSQIDIDANKIKKDVKMIISSTDYDSVETQRREGLYFTITFKNKLTSLTQTEIDNITAYIQEYPSDKIAENLTRQAVVSNDPFNPAKYKSIEHAIGAGKKSIFLKASDIPYTLPQNTVFTPDLTLIGEKKEGCIVDMAGYSITTPLLEYSTVGTSVTFTLNSTTVTGVSTTFTTLNNQSTPEIFGYKKYIEANGQLYEIASIESNTSLTLTETFKNNTVTYPNKRFLLGYFTSNINIKHITLQNSSNCTFNSLVNSSFDDIQMCDAVTTSMTFNLTHNISICNSCFCNTSDTAATVANLRLRDCVGAKIIGIRCLRSGSAGCGLCIDSGVYNSNEISIQTSYFQNNYKGVVIGSPSDPTKNVVQNVVFTNCRMKNNISTGIEMNNYYNVALSPFQNTCIGVVVMNSRVSFNGGDGIVMKGEFCKIMNVAAAFNTGNGIVNSNRNNCIKNSFVSFNTLCWLKCSSSAFSTKNEGIAIHDNIIKSNTEHGIYIDDNNTEGVMISSCKISENTLNGIFIEPTSTTTFVCDKISVCNNSIDDEVVIGGKSAASSNVRYCIIQGNFMKDVTFTENTDDLKFIFNFYESLTNEVLLGTNLTNGNSFNTAI